MCKETKKYEILINRNRVRILRTWLGERERERESKKERERERERKLD